MCGISGVYLQGQVSQNRVNTVEAACQTMIEHQTLRGPDAKGEWRGERVCLGHTRLSIMDPENADSNQPMVADRFVLVFNGEIYNYRVLREQLEVDGAAFHTNSDTEVLLRALEVWGPKGAVSRLNGIFAFAAYDRHDHSLWLARDHLGIKPLYYYQCGEEIWFASSPAAIVNALPGHSWKLDRDALYRFFRLGAPFGRATLFAGIERLAPAEIIEISPHNDMSRAKYWSPEFRERDVRETVREACARQKEAHVPSALFLSGGVDSTVMASCYSDIDFFHLNSPEKKYAKYVAEMNQRELIVSEYQSNLDFEDLNRRYVKTSGEPSASAPIPMQISRAMHQRGYKVAFSANGADELFFGYPRTPAPELHVGNSPANIYEQESAQNDTEQLEHIFRNRRSYTVPGVADSDYESDRWIYESIAPLGEGFPNSAVQRWFELQTYVAYDLNPTLDFASMAYSLEVRVPFLDYELVEAALSSNANTMITADYGRKTPLKRMLKSSGYSPLVWSRAKLGFSIPDEVLKGRRYQLNQALSDLFAEDFLSMTDECEYGSRDYQYLASAAHSFATWKSEWIDSGPVSA